MFATPNSRELLVRVLVLALFSVLGAVSCNPAAAPSKPTIVIVSPPSGSVYSAGEQVAVQSSTADANGIVKVELLADGLPVRVDPSPVSQGQIQFAVIQHWTATTPGSHILTVRAYNALGAFGEAGVSINVNPAAVAQAPSVAPTLPIPTFPPLATVLPTPAPTATPTNTLPPTEIPTAAAIATVPAAATNTTVSPTIATCVLNSQFIADVTIPDGAQINPGASFTKTWRLRNNGTCPWDASYTIAFAGGSNLAGFTQNLIPPTAPGATADISIPMTAPASGGAYSSYWRLRDANGQFFGTMLSAKIISGSLTATLAATPTSTTIPPAQPPSNCSGTPNDFTFSVSPGNISAGQSATLAWSKVDNAGGVFLDGQGVATPGSRQVSPTTTTTYTLEAHCGNQTRVKTVTLNVTGGGGGGSAPTFGGHWNIRNGGVGDCTADFTVSGNSLSGTFCRQNQTTMLNGSLQGTISNNGGDVSASGNYNIPGATNGGFGFIIKSAKPNQFRGYFQAYGMTQEFCGWRDGASPPNNCLAQP